MKMLLVVLIIFNCLIPDAAALTIVPQIPLQTGVIEPPSLALERLINAARARQGLLTLELDDQLTCAASLQSGYLSQVTGVCTHVGIYGSDLPARLDLCGGRLAAGEVLACGHINVTAAVEAWLKSPGHYKIIMDPRIKRMGGTMLEKQWVVTVGF